MRPQAVVTDYGDTLTDPHADPDPRRGQRPVAPDAVIALRALHDLELRLVLASNNRQDQPRRLALREAGVEDLFAAVVLSDEIGIGKPHAEFYRRVITACDVPAGQALWVGNNLDHDVRGPLKMGFGRAVLIGAPPPGTVLPPHSLSIEHIAELPGLIRRWK
ncbi:HAD family hydrolase [Nonomuraea sp. NPDC003707]